MTENETETPVRDAPPPTLQAADFGAPPPAARRRTPRRRAADAAKEAAEPALTTVDESTSTLAAVEIDTAAVVAPDPGDPPAPARAPRRRGGRTRRTPAAEAATEETANAEATPATDATIDAAATTTDSGPAATPAAATITTPAAGPASAPTSSWSTGRRYEIGPDGKVRYLDPGAPAAPASPAAASTPSTPPARSGSRPDRSDKFVWQPGDVTITPPPAARPPASAEAAASFEDDEEVATASAGEAAVGAVEDPDLAPGIGDEGEGSEAVRRRRRSRRGGRGRSRNGSAAEGVLAEAESIAADAMEVDAEGYPLDAVAPAPPTAAPIVPAPSFAPTSSPPPAARPSSLSPLEQLVARQNVILDQLMQRQQEMARSMERALTTIERRLTGTDLTRVSAMPRAGVFVDVPNIIYAADRYNIALDFGKLLDLVAQDRTLIRASAYAPISDDPTLRLEVQRFVQPFLGHGYRIVTKPLKRFNDGSIKANFDIELAMDILTMSERMDIIILVSGDGDFHRLVELVQSKGVRVEVVAFAASTATELKAVADSYIDLTNHLRDLSVDR